MTTTSTPVGDRRFNPTCIAHRADLLCGQGVIVKSYAHSIYHNPSFGVGGSSLAEARKSSVRATRSLCRRARSQRAIFGANTMALVLTTALVLTAYASPPRVSRRVAVCSAGFATSALLPPLAVSAAEAPPLTPSQMLTAGKITRSPLCLCAYPCVCICVCATN